ncbi:MAG: hypothetical protein AAFO06_03125 [Cyanobacteria bacterium J06597_16]
MFHLDTTEPVATLLSKQLDNALESLQQAITLDDTNQYIEMAQTDSDFENIRHEPKFIALLKP